MAELDLRASLIEYLTDASPMFKSEGLKDEDDLDNAGLDSLDMVNFLLSIEESLDVKITDAELETLKTLGDFLGYLKAHGK